ncbi:MAG: hypothetical protein AB3N18_04605 [Allomuricauda sp.]
MKLYSIDFEPMWPVGHVLIILATDKEEAESIATKTVRHTTITEVKEVKMDEPKVVAYLSGDY